MPLIRAVESTVEPKPASPLLVKELQLSSGSPYAETEQLSGQLKFSKFHTLLYLVSTSPNTLPGQGYEKTFTDCPWACKPPPLNHEANFNGK